MNTSDIPALIAAAKTRLTARDGYSSVVLTVSDILPGRAFTFYVFGKIANSPSFSGATIEEAAAALDAWIASDPMRDGNLTLGLDAFGTAFAEAGWSP